MSDQTPPLSYTFEAPRYPEVFTVASQARRPYWLHLLLLLLTFATTLVVGAQLAFNYHHRLPAFEFGPGWMPLFHPIWVWHNPALLLSGLPFAATLMCILMAHEMGHFVLCEKYDIYATLPFFIPAPTLIGTMGAFIRIKSPIRSRQALFDIGIAGPIAGFIAAIPFLFIGLLLSRPMQYPVENPYEIGFPLAFHLAYKLTGLVNHQSVQLSRLSLHPIAVAAWVGMLATALNLLPGGQLDGGHIVYAVAPQLHKRVTRISVVVLGVLGAIGIFLAKFHLPDGRVWSWPTWLVWALVLVITGWRHPAVPLWPGLDKSRVWLAWVAVLLLVLTFFPTPFPRGLF
jgi:membrane-associated protease RseP (regulator of RpoE activity)